MMTDTSLPLVRLLQKRGSKVIGAPWFSDGGIFALDGTPAIAMGPGSIAQAHTRDEWILADDVEQGAEYFRDFLSLV
jgi:hypothetical protein